MQRLRVQKKETAALRQKPLDLAGKHPVSALTEVCQRRGWLSANYSSEQPEGAGFLIKVTRLSLVLLSWKIPPGALFVRLTLPVLCLFPTKAAIKGHQMSTLSRSSDLMKGKHSISA